VARRRACAVRALRYTTPFADGQIAAVAVTNGLRLSTRNVADFAAFTDLMVGSWWTAG
jgi:predicted nucleic acid-binding protein